MFDYCSDVNRKLVYRRLIILIFFAGLFLGIFEMLKILSVSRYIHFNITKLNVELPIIFFVGILPYPVIFLCTDFINELYGKLWANILVWKGLTLNIWNHFIRWTGNVLHFFSETIPEKGFPANEKPISSFYYDQMLAIRTTPALMVSAHLDAIPSNIGVKFFSKHLQINPLSTFVDEQGEKFI